MSRSIKIRIPRWTDPEDRAYLSFFGTLLKGLRMADARVLHKPLNLKRKTVPFEFNQIQPTRKLFPAPTNPLFISDAQTTTLKTIASAAEKVSFEPRALPNSGDLLTIEMIKASDGRVPVYVKR
jgi:hypothetical protein